MAALRGKALIAYLLVSCLFFQAQQVFSPTWPLVVGWDDRVPAGGVSAKSTNKRAGARKKRCIVESGALRA